MHVFRKSIQRPSCHNSIFTHKWLWYLQCFCQLEIISRVTGSFLTGFASSLFAASSMFLTSFESQRLKKSIQIVRPIYAITGRLQCGVWETLLQQKLQVKGSWPLIRGQANDFKASRPFSKFLESSWVTLRCWWGLSFSCMQGKTFR